MVNPFGNGETNTSQARRLDAIALHHMAFRLHTAGVPLLPRLIDYLIFLLFNSTIHHTTQIGRGTRCGYRGMSVLVHRDSVVGAHVMLGPHIVIGGRSGQRAPIIEDGVYIGANACILGGVTIAQCAVVGAGAVVITDVPKGARVAGNPARILQ